MFDKNVTLRFLISKGMSVLGNASAAVVLPIVLLTKTGDPLAAGTLAIACSVPQFLAGLFGGALMDRFNRRNISVISDIISACCVAALPIVEMTVGLNLGWFILLGVLGAVGDIPGMTARNVLLPSTVERDGLNLQRYIGISQAVDSLAVIIGPAMAAVLLGLAGGVNTLWVTAVMSFLAAIVTLTIPSSVGEVNVLADRDLGVTSSVAHSLKDGWNVIFKSRKIIPISLLLSAGLLMILSSYQNLVLPVYFTEMGRPELLGYVLSSISLGLLIGPVAYTVLMEKLKKRTWYVISIVGVGVGMSIMGALPTYPVLLAGGFFGGLLCGPFSALLAYLIVDNVPEENRGAVYGLQNSFMLVAPPAAVFLSSVAVTALGMRPASFILMALLWIVIAYAVMTRHMKNLDDN